MKNKYIGSTLDSFLKKDGILNYCSNEAKKINKKFREEDKRNKRDKINE
jgi:hypothetical protein